MSLWNIPIVPLHLLKVSFKLLLALLLWRGHITVHCMLAISVLPSVVWILWLCEQSNPQFRFFWKEREKKNLRIERTMGSSSYFKKSKNLHKFHERTGKERSTGLLDSFFSLLFYLFLFPWMAVLLQNQFSDFVRTVPGYEIQQASALIPGIGVWCHFWYPHNTGTSPSCWLSKGCFSVIDLVYVAMLDLWGFHKCKFRGAPYTTVQFLAPGGSSRDLKPKLS